MKSAPAHMDSSNSSAIEQQAAHEHCQWVYGSIVDDLPKCVLGLIYIPSARTQEKLIREMLYGPHPRGIVSVLGEPSFLLRPLESLPGIGPVRALSITLVWQQLAKRKRLLGEELRSRDNEELFEGISRQMARFRRMRPSAGQRITIANYRVLREWWLHE